MVVVKEIKIILKQKKLAADIVGHVLQRELGPDVSI